MKEEYRKWINRFPKIVAWLYVGLVFITFFSIGLFLYKNGPDETVTLPAWVLALGIGSFCFKVFLAGFLAFGNVELIKKS